MGGNSFFIDRKTGDVKGYAEKLDFNKIDRKSFTSDFLLFLEHLNTFYRNRKPHGEYLWENQMCILNKSIFSGSSTSLFSDTISDFEFTKHKPIVGDIDIMIPREKGKSLWKFLLEKEGVFFGFNFQYMGNNKKTENGLNQINSVFQYKNNDITVNVQIDFEFVDFERGYPTPWSKFSHYSDWNDTKAGYKGYAHKILLMNAFRGTSFIPKGIYVTKKEAEKISLHSSFDDFKFKISKAKEYENPSNTAFSIDYGIRHKFVRVYWKNNVPVVFDNKPVYRKLDTNESEYITDLKKIFFDLFGIIPQGDELSDMWTFEGVMNLLKRHYKYDYYTIERIFDNMVEKSLFGKYSQKLSRTDKIEDMQIKFPIVYKFFEMFPRLNTEKFDKINEMSKEYYENYSVNVD